MNYIIPTGLFQHTNKSAQEIFEAQQRIEEFRKAMIDQIKVSTELLIKEITI